MANDKRREKKTQDMTIALSGPDTTQKDKRFHTQTDATTTAMMRNSKKQQKTQG